MATAIASKKTRSKARKKSYPNEDIAPEILEKAYYLMCQAKAMTEIYETNAKITSKYVHATSRGHEAVSYTHLTLPTMIEV